MTSVNTARAPMNLVSITRWVTILGLALIGLACLAGIIVPAGLGWDFANFYDAGHKALVGQIADLYDKRALIENRPPQGLMPFLGTPLSSYFYAPLAMVSPTTALILFKIQNTLALWLSLYLIWRHLRPAAGLDPQDQAIFTALFVVAALFFQPLWTIYRVGGQATPTALLLLTLGWIAHSSGRVRLSALLFILAVAIKPFLAPGLVLLVLTSGRQFFIATAVIGAAIAAGSVLLMGWSIHDVFLRMLIGVGSDAGPAKYNSGLFAWMDPAFGGPNPLATNLARLAVVALFTWLALGARRYGLMGAAARSFHFLLALAFSVYVTPVTWNHYLTFLFPMFALLIAARRVISRESQVLVALIVAISVTQNLILLMWVDGKIGIDSRGETLAVTLVNGLPLMLTLWLFLRRRNDLYAAFAAARLGA